MRQAYCFVMTLSYSRHQYAELVFDQKMETWIGCHRRAFEFFGGVPEEIVIDNLKAAVLRAGPRQPDPERAVYSPGPSLRLSGASVPGSDA
jgi:transposase